MNNDTHKSAVRIVQRLADAGHQAFFAGGCVRDHLMGRTPADYDIATSARPEEVEGLFKRTFSVGRQFGVMSVLDGDDQFDVATFRSDGAYVDGRRPEDVEFSTAEEDVKRRDFTINGLLMDPINMEVVDYVGGESDLRKGVIRTIGNADDRFSEDHLRLLRAVRFATRFDFEVEAKTGASMKNLARLAASPSPERIGDELRKMFAEKSPSCALRMLDEYGMLAHVLPEVHAKKKAPLDERLSLEEEVRNPWQRTLKLLDSLDPGLMHPPLVWAIILEDLVPSTPCERARAAEQVMSRLRYSKRLASTVGVLIRSRDRLLFAGRVSAARRRIAEAWPSFELLLAYGVVEGRHARKARVVEARCDQGISLPEPLLKGDELMEMGVPKGPCLGHLLRRMRVKQLNGDLADSDAAREWVRQRTG